MWRVALNPPPTYLRFLEAYQYSWFKYYFLKESMPLKLKRQINFNFSLHLYIALISLKVHIEHRKTPSFKNSFKNMRDMYLLYPIHNLCGRP